MAMRDLMLNHPKFFVFTTNDIIFAVDPPDGGPVRMAGGFHTDGIRDFIPALVKMPNEPGVDMPIVRYANPEDYITNANGEWFEFSMSEADYARFQEHDRQFV